MMCLHKGGAAGNSREGQLGGAEGGGTRLREGILEVMVPEQKNELELSLRVAGIPEWIPRLPVLPASHCTMPDSFV